MPTSIAMPQLGESVTEGVVVRWLKKEGEFVDRDEPMAEIVTDKVNADMASPHRGVIVKLVVAEGTTVPVGGEIALIEVEAAVPVGISSPSGPTLENVERAEETATAAPSNQAGQGDGDSSGEEHRRYTPVVKRLAQEHDIDLTQVSGTGMSGRVTKNDVLSYIAERGPRRENGRSAAAYTPPMSATALDVEIVLPPSVAQSVPAAPSAGLVVEAAPTPAPSFAPPPVSAPRVPAPVPTPPTVRSAANGDEELVPLTPMRRAIAEHMVRSKTTAPHATTTIDVDMTHLVRWRERSKEAVKARHGVDITFLPLVISAIVAALKDFPILNSSWSDDGIILKRRINIGIAVGLDDGLIVPVIHDADERNTVGLARAVADLSARARAGRLTRQDIEGGTFTANNTGVFGAVMTTPVINQPQAAILAMNAIVKKPVVIEDDAIAVRSIMTLSLSFDHRIVDGLTAGRFNQRVAQNITRIDPSDL